jgi:hypothetical protein
MMMRAAACAAFLLCAAARAGWAGVPPGWEAGYDFMVQDVCVDAKDHVIANATPLDGKDKCPRHRDLRAGEAPPYHKDDWAPAREAGRVNGLQSNDTFPIATKAYPAAVVQLRSFVDADGRPRPFEPGHGGGGVFLFSDNTIASGITQDPNGLQFFYGPGCASTDPARQILDAWVVVDKSFDPSRPGHMVARLSRFMKRCDRLTYSYTSWLTRPIEFRVRSGGAESKKTLETLVTDHFGGPTADGAPNMERFYLTRELGLMRWERWQNFDRQKRAADPHRAEQMESSGQCDSVERPPQASGNWKMVRCRQYTNLVQTLDPTGDLQRSWLATLRTDPATRALFGE